jgi:hypothetical protein
MEACDTRASHDLVSHSKDEDKLRKIKTNPKSPTKGEKLILKR